MARERTVSWVEVVTKEAPDEAAAKETLALVERVLGCRGAIRKVEARGRDWRMLVTLAPVQPPIVEVTVALALGGKAKQTLQYVKRVLAAGPATRENPPATDKEER